MHCWHALAKKVSVCQVPKFYRSRVLPVYAGRCSHEPTEPHDPSTTITTHPITILGFRNEGLHVEEKMNTSSPPLYSTPPSAKQKPKEDDYNEDDGFQSPLFQFPADLSDQFDFLTQCHSPTELFSFFSKGEGGGDNNMINNTNSIHDDGGEYNIVEEDDCPYPFSKTCEYCGANSIHDCDPSVCKRPKSFFVTQRPPFVPNEKWIVKVANSNIKKEKEEEEKKQIDLETDALPPKAEKKTWIKNPMTNLFGTS